MRSAPRLTPKATSSRGRPAASLRLGLPALALVCAVGLVWAFATEALGRPGGGSRYSGSRSYRSSSSSSSRSYGSSSRSSGSSSSSRSYGSSSRSYGSSSSSRSSGSSGGSTYHGGSATPPGSHGGHPEKEDGLIGMLGFVIQFLIPVGLLVVVGGGIAYAFRGPRKKDEWDSGGGHTYPAPPEPDRETIDLSRLREFDPHFSQVVFEDFVYGLYVRAQESRPGAALGALSAYLREEPRQVLATRGGRSPAEVAGVIVGSQTVFSMSPTSQRMLWIEVLFESNYTERYPPESGLGEATFYARECWRFVRRRDAKSRAPDQVFSYHCPNCAGPVEQSQDDKCAYCGEHFASGEFDWAVETISLEEEDPRPPQLLGDTVQEGGTDLPTIGQPNRKQHLAALQERDPAFTLEGLMARVALIFGELQEAWSGLTWDRIRPYVTDRFFLSQQYWIDAYRRQGLRNVLTGARIVKHKIVKVVSDPYFDAVTLRIWGTGLDYTVDAEGKVVGGSNTTGRDYSEYWTFVRSAQVAGPARTEKSCPNCGGPLQVNQTGNCEACGSKVSGGAFDWSLSRIEQDESYHG